MGGGHRRYAVTENLPLEFLYQVDGGFFSGGVFFGSVGETLKQEISCAATEES